MTMGANTHTAGRRAKQPARRVRGTTSDLADRDGLAGLRAVVEHDHHLVAALERAAQRDVEGPAPPPHRPVEHRDELAAVQDADSDPLHTLAAAVGHLAPRDAPAVAVHHLAAQRHRGLLLGALCGLGGLHVHGRAGPARGYSAGTGAGLAVAVAAAVVADLVIPQGRLVRERVTRRRE